MSPRSRCRRARAVARDAAPFDARIHARRLRRPVRARQRSARDEIHRRRHAVDAAPKLAERSSGSCAIRGCIPDLGIWHTSRRDTGAFIGWFSLKYAGKTHGYRDRLSAAAQCVGLRLRDGRRHCARALRLRRPRTRPDHRRHASGQQRVAERAHEGGAGRHRLGALLQAGACACSRRNAKAHDADGAPGACVKRPRSRRCEGSARARAGARSRVARRARAGSAHRSAVPGVLRFWRRRRHCTASRSPT